MARVSGLMNGDRQDRARRCLIPRVTGEGGVVEAFAGVVGFSRPSSSDFSSHRQQTPEHGEHISPHFDLAVSVVAPRYRYFRNRKSLFVGFCYKLCIERKTVTVDIESVP